MYGLMCLSGKLIIFGIDLNERPIFNAPDPFEDYEINEEFLLNVFFDEMLNKNTVIDILANSSSLKSKKLK